MKPDHPFFAKNYIAPKKEKKQKVGILLDNSDGFFSNLEGVANRYEAKRNAGNQNKRVNQAIDRV